MSKTAKNKKLNDAYLAKRREQKKMSMRKAREKLKNNPEKHEEIKLKRRQNYKKLKEEGKIKSIEDFSAREQRKIRKEWKIRSKNYRRRQKRQEVEQEFVSNNTPPLSPQAMEVQNVQLPTTSRQKDSGKKLARRNRDKKNKEIKKLKEKLKKTESKLLRYKSKLFRLKNKNLDQKKVDDSPRKVVDELVQGKSVSKEIKKKLLFGEVLAKQLKENFKKTKIRKRTFISCVTGDVVQRYRMEGKVRLLTSRISVCTNYLEKRRINHRTKILSLKIKEFLERDDNSRNTAGKKETITRKKLKKQKRFLNDTLKNLHTKFVKENPEYTHLSYSTFCIHRPFWVTIPTAAARDTCLCKKHANFGLLVSKLKRLNLINEKTPRDVLAQLCCPGELKEKCLQRDCENCSTKSIQFNHFNGAEESSFEKWVTKKVPVMIKGKIKLCQKTIKITEHCELSRLVGELKKLIVPFMKHVCNIIHQFKVIQDVKENLTEFEALFHFDYSQNYSCKYGSEIQSFHFGGSRSQITLQTSVVYFKDQSQKSLQHKSFCTISENLRHDPSAVCAHLDPVICTMKGMIPNLKKVHLLSDGPATQYKNKKMFHLFGNYLSKKLDVDEVVWHYSEAGHGKGAADGIGGSTKRLADSLVGRGFDIANFEQFKNALEANCKATTIFSITTDQIEIIDRILPQQIETFPGTMQVHQVTWDREKPRVIQARRLSCMKCSSNKTCLHYHLGEIIVETAQSKVSASNSKKLHYSDVYSSDESGTDEKIIQTNPKVNNYVLVKFEGKNQIYHYIGIVMKTFQDEFLIKFMKKSGSKFVWPEKEDVSSVELKDIVAVLDEPNINNRQQYEFLFDSKHKISVGLR